MRTTEQVSVVFIFFHKTQIRTCEGFGVKKTVWYTVFSQKSLSGSESQSVCKALAAADGES